MLIPAVSGSMTFGKPHFGLARTTPPRAALSRYKYARAARIRAKNGIILEIYISEIFPFSNI